MRMARRIMWRVMRIWWLQMYQQRKKDSQNLYSLLLLSQHPSRCHSLRMLPVHSLDKERR